MIHIIYTMLSYTAHARGDIVPVSDLNKATVNKTLNIHMKVFRHPVGKYIIVK